ncbi:RNA polymerase sigma factor [Aquisphaera giovannonii]|uniref:RNA polymerase sigma factor n=1 Tax=Aquisphaera giovannonii TaxID=406548 RepID=A0A5B9VZF0_9BACT|nr:sigma-70 family RNA polymerase sigma factor [Aquisphaera giovannonii]QEH33351.1 RNA polymerase sigma factor [Aquisphaera giovannonii]
MTAAPLNVHAGGGDDDIRQLLDRIRRGDEDAACELMRRYESKIRMVIRRRLPRVLRTRLDSLDLLQSVWGSFFRHIRDGDDDIEGEQNLVTLLAWAARNKVVDQQRHAMTLKHDVRRERSVDRAVIDDRAFEVNESPSRAAEAKEAYERLMAGLPEGRRAVLEMKVAGYSCREVAERLGLSERTVQRIVEGLRNRTRDEG